MNKYFFGLLSLLFSFSFVSAQTFSDLDEDNKYQESILGLVEEGVVQGYPDGTFRSSAGVTRAEMMKIVLESSLEDSSSLEGQKNCFPDVTNQWYAQYVCYGKEQGMIKGYPDGSFRPDKLVTIAEGLKIAVNAFDYGIDEGEGDDWYRPYLDFVHDNGVFSSYGLAPERIMTRGEMSEVAYQMLLEKKGLIDFDQKRDSRSPGCFTDRHPSQPPTSFEVRGETRSVIADIGRKVTHNKPSPLIILFHGRTNSNSQVRDYYKVQREAQGEGIWIYPSGLPENSSPRSRRAHGDSVDEMRGFDFFDAIVDVYSEEYCVDMDKIFVVGHSLGGWFSNTLACARGDVINGVASVGGSITSQSCSGPVNAMIMHNPDDRLASFAGGEQARDHALQQNGCDTVAVPYVGGPQGGNCVEYTGCLEGSSVVRCPHSDSTAYNGAYYPHTWPNFAGDTIWDFLIK